MASQATWSGKLQIDGGQTLLLGGQAPLGAAQTPFGSESLPVTLAESDGQTATTQRVRVLAAPELAHILAVKADAYHDKDSATGVLKAVFSNADGSVKSDPITLADDLLVTGKEILKAVSRNWVTIELSSTIKQDVSIQILVVREL